MTPAELAKRAAQSLARMLGLICVLGLLVGAFLAGVVTAPEWARTCGAASGLVLMVALWWRYVRGR